MAPWELKTSRSMAIQGQMELKLDRSNLYMYTVRIYYSLYCRKANRNISKIEKISILIIIKK